MLSLAAAQPFNSDIYIVAATVVPVYFLALMLPGGLLARYRGWAKRQRPEEDERVLMAMASGKRTKSIPLIWILAVWDSVRMWPVNLCVLLGCLGEIEAVLALDHRRASRLEHELVTWALVALPILTAVLVVVSPAIIAAEERINKTRADAEPPSTPEQETVS